MSVNFIHTGDIPETVHDRNIVARDDANFRPLGLNRYISETIELQLQWKTNMTVFMRLGLSIGTNFDYADYRLPLTTDRKALLFSLSDVQIVRK